MRNKLNRVIIEYAKMREIDVESLSALKSMNYIMALQAAVLGINFLGPTNIFLRPTTPPDDWWLTFTYFGVELWDILFPLGAIILVVCTAILRRISMAHGFLAFVWGTLGVVWSIGGLMNSPTHYFGVGLISIFISALHISIIRLWRAEGVN